MTCAECNAKLRPVGGDEGDEAELDQYHNALPVHLDGGYGMFYDFPLDGGAEEAWDEKTKMLKVVFCHDCAHRLAHAFPKSVGRLLRNGHMNPAGGFDACPDYEGSDT